MNTNRWLKHQFLTFVWNKGVDDCHFVIAKLGKIFDTQYMFTQKNIKNLIFRASMLGRFVIFF